MYLFVPMLILIHKLNLKVSSHFIRSEAIFLTLGLSSLLMIWWSSPMITSGTGAFLWGNSLITFSIYSVGTGGSFLFLLGSAWINFIFLGNCSFHQGFQIYLQSDIKLCSFRFPLSQ